MLFKLIHIVLFSSIITITVCKHERNFKIDYHNNVFLKDGQPFRYISGSIHYFRLVEDYWDDMLKKFKLAGLNALTTYVEWASHQPDPEETYKFSGNLNLFKFLQLAQQNELLVILRPGPFIDAERDMGGLPPWLLWQKPDMKIRTKDLEYVYFVSRWFDHLLPRLKPYLYSNGGPIIMVQVENEYGSFSCDKEYPMFLRDLIKSHLGNDTVLFTTDGDGESYLKCGSLPDVYPTIDFGPGSLQTIKEAFNVQRKFADRGPLVNSEFYPGWLDHWQTPHSKTPSQTVAHALDNMLSLGANVNFYMFYGGTSFGIRAGSNLDGSRFDPCPTSYDYDAPLNEAGDATDKYYDIKGIISRYLVVPQENPKKSFKGNYGKVHMIPHAELFNENFLNFFSKGRVFAENPMSFEELKIGSGFVLYTKIVDFLTPDPAMLTLHDLKDRAYVYVDNKLVGILSRQQNIYSLPLFIQKGQILKVLVENQGRPCYGSNIGESKGIGVNVTLSEQILRNWTMYRIGELNGKNLQKFPSTLSKSKMKRESGVFYIGNFSLPKGNYSILDTFVKFNGWRKGMIWINGFNLGRYWPVAGPQETLYLPGPLLVKAPLTNTIVMFELEGVPPGCIKPNNHTECVITMTDTPMIDGPTPYTKQLMKFKPRPQDTNYFNDLVAAS